MIDYSSMSDEEISKLYEAEVAKDTTPDYSSMSDEEITKLYKAEINNEETLTSPSTIERMEQLNEYPNPFGDREPSLTPDPISMDEYYDDTIVPNSKSFQAGTAATFAGLYQSGLDLATDIGIDVKEESDENLEVIKILNEAIRATDGDDIFTMANLGKMAPSLATLPVAYASKIMAFLIEGALATGEARGEGMDKWESRGMGVLVGGLTAGTMKAIDYLTKDSAEKVYKYVIDMNNITEETANTYFSKWSKIMNADDTFANRTKAIIDKLGDKGANTKVEAAAGDPLATKQIEASIKERREAVQSLADGADGVEYTSESVEEASGVIKENYSRVKDFVSKNEVDMHLDIPDALDEATMGDTKALKVIFNNPHLTTKDLVDAMPHINSLLRKTKGATKHQWSVIKDRIEGGLKNNLSSKDFSMWKEANKDYAKMAKVTNSKIGKIMDLVRQGDMEPQEAMKKIKTMSGGKSLFKDLSFMIGTEKTEAFEKAILKEAMGKNSEFVDWAHLARNMDSKGFVTETGKNIKKVVDQMADSFITDDAIQEIYFRDKGLVAGMSDDIMAKIRYSIVGKTFTSLVKRIPFNETSKHMLRMDQLADILKQPTKVKNLMEQFNDLAPGVKQKFLEDTVTEATKQLPYKPGSKPMYASEKGAVGKSPSDVTLHEAQKQLVQEALESPIATDKVMHVVNKMMKGKRAESIIRNVSNRMKVDDAIGNQNMLRKIVQQESDYIVKAIEKDMGVKLPASEAEKIYKLKVADMLKECE